MKAYKKDRRTIWRVAHPWVRFVEWARRRCNCTDPRGWFPLYGAKGIECHLDGKQLEEIWKRDKAWEVQRPSLDRRDPKFSYVNWNVRFVEFNRNSRMAWDPTARDGYSIVAPEFI